VCWSLDLHAEGLSLKAYHTQRTGRSVFATNNFCKVALGIFKDIC
jgi:hypothetical protein